MFITPEQRLHMLFSCNDRLMPGETIGCMHLKILRLLPTGFYLSICDLFLPQDMKGLKMLEDIYPLLFQRGHFQSPFILHIFRTVSGKYKALKISPECCTFFSNKKHFHKKSL